MLIRINKIKYLLFLTVIFISAQVNSQNKNFDIIIKKHHISKMKMKSNPKYDGRYYLDMEFDFVNNSEDTITVFNLRKSDKRIPFQTAYYLPYLDNPSFNILIKTKGISSDNEIKENKKENLPSNVEFNESKLNQYNEIILSKHILFKIPPSSKKNFWITKEIPKYNTDSILIMTQLKYSTLNIDKKRFKKELKKLERELYNEVSVSKKSKIKEEIRIKNLFMKISEIEVMSDYNIKTLKNIE